MKYRSRVLPITLTIIALAWLGVALIVFRASEVGTSLGKDDSASLSSVIDTPVTLDSGSPGMHDNVPNHGSKPEHVSGPVVRNSTSGSESPTFFNDDQEMSIPATLESMALEHGWSERTLLVNKALWGPVCDAAKSYADSPMNADDLARIDARMLAGKKLVAICRYLSDEVELAALDAFLDNSVTDDTNRAAIKRELETALELSSSEEAMRLAGTEIRAALERDDEALVQSIISLLALDEDVLDPFLDSELNYLPAYLNVTGEVASTLMCEWNGGCRGDLHPYVLRQCANRYLEVGAFCYHPGTIEQAIYQTLTPLEFAAYNAFVNQVRMHLSKP